MLKKLMMGAAFATLLASPVLAQTDALNTDPGVSYTAGTQSYAYAPRARGSRAFAYVPRAAGQAGSVYSGRVYEDGAYVGQDPDPNVRLQLRRDYPWE
jgi:hypothetical protein